MHNQLTLENMKKLQEELEYRFTTLRGKIAKEKQIAAAFGDRSENAEYKAACEEYRNNDKRIQYLLTMLSTATIIDEIEEDANVLGVNKRAKVKFSNDDSIEIVKLVTTIDVDLDNMAISIESSLGKALSGRRVGETVEVNAPGGAYDVTILEILGKEE